MGCRRALPEAVQDRRGATVMKEWRAPTDAYERGTWNATGGTPASGASSPTSGTASWPVPTSSVAFIDKLDGANNLVNEMGLEPRHRGTAWRNTEGERLIGANEPLDFPVALKAPHVRVHHGLAPWQLLRNG